MMSADISIIASNKSEREIATDLRDRMRTKLVEVGALLDEANREGMRINFQMAVDSFGRNVVGVLDVTKPVA